MTTRAGFALLAALLASTPAVAQQPSPWFYGNHVALRAYDPSQEMEADWLFELTDNGDMRLGKHERFGDHAARGTALVVGGRAMALRGIGATPGRELETVDGPSLLLMLSFTLLDGLFPGGPETVPEESDEVDVRETEQWLRVATASAYGEFATPWHVRGSVRRGGDGTISFTLAFQSAEGPGGVRAYQVSLFGTWSEVKPAPVLPGALSLKGWDVFWIEPVGEAPPGRPGHYATQPAPQFDTLGELRTALGEPGERQAPAALAAADAAALQAVKDWADAWSRQDVASYLAAYSPAYVGPGSDSRAAWEKTRSERLSRPRGLSVKVEAPQVRSLGTDRAEVRFRQIYRSDSQRSDEDKILVLERSGERWLIVDERVAGR